MNFWFFPNIFIHCRTLKVYQISIFKVNFPGQKRFFLYEYEARRTTFKINIFIYIIFKISYFLKMCLYFEGSAAKEYRLTQNNLHVSWWNILGQGTLLHIVNVGLIRDFLIDGRCISTFFLKLSKNWNILNSFHLHIGKKIKIMIGNNFLDIMMD